MSTSSELQNDTSAQFSRDQPRQLNDLYSVHRDKQIAFWLRVLIIAILITSLSALGFFLFNNNAGNRGSRNQEIIKPIDSCIPSGGTGNYFNNDKCCPGSKVHIYTVDEGPPVGNGRFTCE